MGVVGHIAIGVGVCIAGAVTATSLATYLRLKESDKENTDNTVESISVDLLTPSELLSWFQSKVTEDETVAVICNRDALIRNGAPNAVYESMGKLYVVQSLLKKDCDLPIASRCIHYKKMEDNLEQLLSNSGGCLVIEDFKDKKGDV